MGYLDPRNNRDIIEKIRRRYLTKGVACVLSFLVEAAAFLLLGWHSFAERFGVGNGVAVFLILAAIPFFVLGLHRELADRSWEGIVTSAKKVIKEKNTKSSAPNKGDDSFDDYIKLMVELEDGETKTVFAPMDELSLFRSGDRIRHIRGTKHYQLYRPGREHTDCVMCGRAADRGTHTCPHCHFSLVKYDPPEEEAS
ncbi:MAG: hypothetical protein IJD06_00830 [Clostridia bacterium]|nr:hypothetical protein [Clostridia bacterium]